MAKKAAATESAKGTSKRRGMLAPVTREALKDLGRHATQAQVEGWIKNKYPTMPFSSKSLSTTLSNQRKRMFGNASQSTGGKLTYDEMRQVKEAAGSEGGIDALTAMVERVGVLSDKVGGFARLRECLNGLRELRS